MPFFSGLDEWLSLKRVLSRVVCKDWQDRQKKYGLFCGEARLPLESAVAEVGDDVFSFQ